MCSSDLIEHDTSGTSVTDFDELYEQIFDDLDSGFFQTELSKYLPDRGEMNTALSNFLESLRQVDRERTATIELRDPWTLLASEQWGVLRDAAQAVLNSN